MKKIYVYSIDTGIVDNIEKIHISDIHRVANGSCDLIICDALDTLSFSDRLIATQEIFKKASISCSIILRFMSLKLFAKYITSDKLDITQINHILNVCHSMHDEGMVDQILNSYSNFVVKENSYNGLMRQMTLERIS